jgi:hypothetical protein
LKYGKIIDDNEPVILDENLNVVFKVDDISTIFPDYTGFGFSDNYISVVWHKYVSNDAIEVTTAMINYDLNVIIEPNKYSYIMEIDKDHFWVIEHLASLRGKASN